jgi:hypothetical protein
MRAAYPNALTSTFVDSRTESIIEIIGEETSLRANRMFSLWRGRQHTGNTDNCCPAKIQSVFSHVYRIFGC